MRLLFYELVLMKENFCVDLTSFVNTKLQLTKIVKFLIVEKPFELKRDSQGQ